MRTLFVSIPLFAALLWSSVARADTLTVGPGKTHPAPCAAFAAAKDGDTIEIDAAGTYAGDVCAIAKNKLTIRGVNGRPKIDADGKSSGGKAIWVIQGNDVTVDNIEMTGAAVPDQNGAGIRQEGTNLTVQHCYFHDNQDGILAGDKAGSTITIEYSEFAHNGAGDGQSHNLYINHVAELIFRFNYSHDAKVGHLLKSRALKSLIAYNRLDDGAGDASYEINLPSAGTSYVIGNVIEQSENTGNSAIIDYGSEPATLNTTTDLYVVNNTVINRRAGGGTFVQIGASIPTAAKLVNNIFFGPGNVTNQDAAVQTTNYTGADPKFVNPDAFDFHLREESPCANAGTAPGMAGTFDLTPNAHYVHPTSSSGRTVAGGAIDIGAYELGGETAPPGDGGVSPTDGGPGGGPAGSSSSSGSSSDNASSRGASSNATPSSDDDGGCGCRTAPARGHAVLGLGALASLVLVARRRRRTRA